MLWFPISLFAKDSSVMSFIDISPRIKTTTTTKYESKGKTGIVTDLGIEQWNVIDIF